MATNTLRKLIQHQAYFIVLWQLVGVAVLSLATLFIAGLYHAYSVLLGGMAYGFANLIFVWRVFRYVGAQQMNQFIVAFFLGEMLKLILSAVLVLIIVKYLAVSLLSLLMGFVGAIISFWLVCMWYFSSKRPVTTVIR